MVNNSTNINKTYDIGNPGPGSGKAQKFDGVELVNEITTLPY
jgi:hypothetical protein